MDILDTDVWCFIFEYISFDDMIKLSWTCKMMKRFINAHILKYFLLRKEKKARIDFVKNLKMHLPIYTEENGQISINFRIFSGIDLIYEDAFVSNSTIIDLIPHIIMVNIRFEHIFSAASGQCLYIFYDIKLPSGHYKHINFELENPRLNEKDFKTLKIVNNEHILNTLFMKNFYHK